MRKRAAEVVLLPPALSSFHAQNVLTGLIRDRGRAAVNRGVRGKCLLRVVTDLQIDGSAPVGQEQRAAAIHRQRTATKRVREIPSVGQIDMRLRAREELAGDGQRPFIDRGPVRREVGA